MLDINRVRQDTDDSRESEARDGSHGAAGGVHREGSGRGQELPQR